MIGELSLLFSTMNRIKQGTERGTELGTERRTEWETERGTELGTEGEAGVGGDSKFFQCSL